jgi:hypothetical protein
MQLDIDVSVTPEERINLSGEDAGVIIGKYGETMKALEYIVNLTERNDEESRASGWTATDTAYGANRAFRGWRSRRPGKPFVAETTYWSR